MCMLFGRGSTIPAAISFWCGGTVRKTCERAMCDEVLPFVSFPSLVLFFSFLLGYGTQLSETAAWHYKTRDSRPFCTTDLPSLHEKERVECLLSNSVSPRDIVDPNGISLKLQSR